MIEKNVCSSKEHEGKNAEEGRRNERSPNVILTHLATSHCQPENMTDQFRLNMCFGSSL